MIVFLLLASIISSVVGTECSGIDCDSTETCCPDPHNGGICCIKETTFCCAPDSQHPSRCCPRWMVCCVVGGEYGCCDPGMTPKEPHWPQAGKPKGSSTGYALFYEAKLTRDPMEGLAIDLATGAQTQHKLSGQFNDWGEIPRVFTYDSSNNVFYLPQANFLVTAPYPITLYTAHPDTGVTKTVKVTGGPANLVTGFYYNNFVNKLYLANYKYQEPSNSNSTKVGYSFYTVDVTTGTASLLYTHTFGSAGDDWCGWFKHGSKNGDYVFRVGYKNPEVSDIPGVGITQVTSSGVTPTFITNIKLPSSFSWFQTIHEYPLNTRGARHQAGSTWSFIGLVEEPVFKVIHLAQFSSDGTVNLIGNWTNAHLPHYFGPVVGCVDYDTDMYYAVVVKDAEPKDFSRWVMATVDITKKLANETILTPFMEAETESVSGVGIPKQ